MNLPSIKTLEQIAHDRDGARRMRKFLESGFSAHSVLLACDQFIRKGCGVEHIPRGNNAKSPAIDYVNCGDTYTTTLMYVHGRGYVVGCWGDIVERGDYP